MRTILLIGSAVNCIGGISIILSMFIPMPFCFPKLPAADAINPDDYLLYRLFTAGTAFCFSSMYLYLYFYPEFAFPFLVFGMALKYWAFMASVIAYIKSSLPVSILVNFGVTNLCVAVLFSVYLIFR